MTKPSMTLQELRRRIYREAKAEKTWRFWGLYVHVCKIETLKVAYQEAKANDGAPGLDGVSFESIEAQGVEEFFEAQCADGVDFKEDLIALLDASKFGRKGTRLSRST